MINLRNNVTCRQKFVLLSCEQFQVATNARSVQGLFFWHRNRCDSRISLYGSFSTHRKLDLASIK